MFPHPALIETGFFFVRIIFKVVGFLCVETLNSKTTNMKTAKRTIFFLLPVLFAGTVSAQNLYLNIGAGYAFPSASQVIDVNHTSASDENVYGSFGKGFNFGAGIGYMFSDHIGAELGFSYLSGATCEVMDDAVLYEYHGKMFRIKPALKITAGDDVKPYAKFGVVFGVGTKVNVDISGVDGNDVVAGEEELSGGTSTGWFGAFGLDFHASDRLSVFVELEAISQSWTPDKYEESITFTNGNVSVTQVESRILVDERPDGAAGQALAPAEPFSSIGINAGIKLSF
jgi:hypothetical protein